MAKKTRKLRKSRRRTRRHHRRHRGGSHTFPIIPDTSAIRVSNPESSDNILAFKN